MEPEAFKLTGDDRAKAWISVAELARNAKLTGKWKRPKQGDGNPEDPHLLVASSYLMEAVMLQSSTRRAPQEPSQRGEGLSQGLWLVRPRSSEIQLRPLRTP